MEGKKISFGFMKTKKVEKPVVEEKRDYIECLEEKSIKVVGGEEVAENIPLVIPMKPNTLITAERLKEIAEKVEKDLDEPEPPKNADQIEESVPENETLDQMAVRELLQKANSEVKVETSVMTVPVPAKPVMEGQKESTLDDYESVPIQDFGLAMLRGMGWTPNKEQSKYNQPQLRPKGLGLGADKVISDKQKKKSSKDKEEDLTIVKNSFVKITTGKYSGFYGRVVSLDEDNGRVMVDIGVKKETVSLSEFMMHAVNKAEYDRESKVLNADSYEEFKKKERSQKPRSDAPKSRDREASSSQKSSEKIDSQDYRNEKKEISKKDKEYSSNGRSRDGSERERKYSSGSEERSSRRRKKDKKRYSSHESLSSLSDTEKRRKHKSKKKYSSESDSDKRDRRRKSATPEGKRDIDKKRKGKKKKRDRDRSPNYRKHRK